MSEIEKPDLKAQAVFRHLRELGKCVDFLEIATNEKSPHVIEAKKIKARHELAINSIINEFDTGNDSIKNE